MLLEAASYHGIVTALHRAYRGCDAQVTPDGLADMAANRRATAMRITHWSVQVSEWLRDAGVPHAIVKGPAVAAAYPNADREFVDLDLLVAPSTMPLAIAALEQHGAQPLEHLSWPRSDGVAELTFGLPSGVAVDLHADLIHRAEVRREFRFASEPLLARARSTRVLGRTIPVLDPEDNLTHVALHAMLSGGDRLVWLADLDALVRTGDLHWPVLIERAREERLALVTCVMLQRASIVLDTPVPRSSIEALRRKGVAWSWVLAAFEHRRPTSTSYGRNFRGQVLMRSTRDSTVASLFALGRLIWTDVILFVLTDPDHPWRRRRGRSRDVHARGG